jgi:hypothetical protein
MQVIYSPAGTRLKNFVPSGDTTRGTPTPVRWNMASLHARRPGPGYLACDDAPEVIL